MRRHTAIDKILALTGLAMVWFPLLAPVLLGAQRLVASGQLRVDYLLPAELFPMTLMGAALLIWAANRLQAYDTVLKWGITAMVGGLVASQVTALATGLASGAAEAAGWRLVLTASLLGVYIVATIVVAIAGIPVTREAFTRHEREPAAISGPPMQPHAG